MQPACNFPASGSKTTTGMEQRPTNVRIAPHRVGKVHVRFLCGYWQGNKPPDLIWEGPSGRYCTLSLRADHGGRAAEVVDADHPVDRRYIVA